MAYSYITSTGVILPDTSTLLEDVANEFRAALGDDLIITPDTPEGALIVAEVSARDSVLRNNCAIANQINPNVAGGLFLDAIWALTGGEREQTTASTAVCDVTGIAGTVVSTLVRFRSSGGESWAVSQSTTIGAGGTASVPVVCTTSGPIAAPADTITQIDVGVLGLETVTNPEAATLGTLTQSDPSVRKLRRRTLAIQGVGLPMAIQSALYDVAGVKSLSFRENVTGGTLIIDGVTLVEHSIYVCVDGGTDDDIAFALVDNKSLGGNWNGDVEVDVVDSSSGQTYTAKFDRPDPINLLARVTVRVSNPLINPQEAVRTAILAYAAGDVEGEDGFVVGGGASPFELAGAISIQEPNIYVKKLELALADDGIFSTNEIPIAIFEVARINASAISVLIE